MGYTPEEQRLNGPLTQILDGFNKFEAAITARADDSREWKEEHIEDLQNLRIEMLPFKIKLEKLKRETC